MYQSMFGYRYINGYNAPTVPTPKEDESQKGVEKCL